MIYQLINYKILNVVIILLQRDNFFKKKIPPFFKISYFMTFTNVDQLIGKIFDQIFPISV